MTENLSLFSADSQRTHVVTGATGFVGSALILELLQRTEGLVIAIVRPRENQTPAERLRQLLDELVHGYALPDSVHLEVATRVLAVAGDIEQDQCGIDTTVADALHGAEFWHCAASLQYQERHRTQIERTNVLGTANVVKLAERSKCPVFNMTSTAYVVGTRRGDVPAEVPDIRLVNNCYERSKIMAEEQVQTSHLRARILRPSVVIGHSLTQHSISSDGLYGFVRNLTKFRNALERTQPGLATTLQVSIHVHADGRLDLVPVDSVVADAVGLSNAGAEAGYYHLTNPAPVSLGHAVSRCFELSGLNAPRMVESRDQLGAVDMKLQQRIDFYSSYLINSKRFDRSSVQAVLGNDARAGFDLDNGRFDHFCTWFLDRLEGSRPRVPVLR